MTSPVPRRIAHALIDGLRSDSRVQEPSARQVFPEVELAPYEQAVRHALALLHPDSVEPVWRDARRAALEMRHEGFFISHRGLHVEAPPGQVFETLARLARDPDWLHERGLWRFRAKVDSLLTGQQRGRDIYRVEVVQPGVRLLIHAELKAPGDGWMEWRVEPEGTGTRLSQTGFFAPRGLPGFLYWYASLPLHALAFRGLLRAAAKEVLRAAEGGTIRP